MLKRWNFSNLSIHSLTRRDQGSYEWYSGLKERHLPSFDLSIMFRLSCLQSPLSGVSASCDHQSVSSSWPHWFPIVTPTLARPGHCPDPHVSHINIILRTQALKIYCTRKNTATLHDKNNLFREKLFSFSDRGDTNCQSLLQCYNLSVSSIEDAMMSCWETWTPSRVLSPIKRETRYNPSCRVSSCWRGDRRQQPGPAVSCQTGSESVTGRQRGEGELVVTGLWRLWRL